MRQTSIFSFLAGMLMASAAHAVASKSECGLDGTYVRADTVGPHSQVLRIKGRNAVVFEQALRLEPSGLASRPVQFLGKPKDKAIYEVRAEPPMPNGVRVFDLMDGKSGSAAYSGFDMDCKSLQVDHPSIGRWIRI